MIYIVGIGPGHKDYIMPRAIEVMRKSDIVIGFKRAIDSLDFLDLNKLSIKKLSDIDKFICSEENKNISIVASGDPTFYGITNYIKIKAISKVQVIPGISSFQYLTCKMNMPWNNAYLGSLHGRSDDFLKIVRKYNLSIWLTDKENNPSALCKILYDAQVDCNVIIGENLSYENEIISEGNPRKFLNKEYSPLSIFIVNRGI